MSEKVVLVTGTSSGIGRALAEVLVEKGHRVFGSSRRGSEGAPKSVTQLKLDVRDEASVRAAVAEVKQQAGRIDVLINNAGVIHLGALEEVSVDAMKDNFDTNYFGTVRMTQAVLPIMRAQGAGQIINIGSIGGRIASPYICSYSATKFALEAFSQALRVELMPFNIKVSLLGPSWVKSGMPERETRASARIAAYEPARELMYKRFDQEIANGEDTVVIAREMAKVVDAKKPKARYNIGKSARQYHWVLRIAPELMNDSAAMKYWKLDSTFDAQAKLASAT